MGKIRFKKPSESFEKFASPNVNVQNKGRLSIGLDESVKEYFMLSLNVLIPFKEQARLYFNDTEINQLAESIKNYGVRQPLSVVKSVENPDKFEIVSGERRVRAAKIAGLSQVPCIILSNYDEAEAVAIIENIHRADLHPVELARAYDCLLLKNQFASVNVLADSFGVSRSVIYEIMRILNLPEDVQQLLISKNIRSRDTIRKLLISDNPLGDLTKVDKQKNKSILRVAIKDNTFFVQKGAVDNLNNDEKTQLKNILEEILELLK